MQQGDSNEENTSLSTNNTSNTIGERDFWNEINFSLCAVKTQSNKLASNGIKAQREIKEELSDTDDNDDDDDKERNSRPDSCDSGRMSNSFSRSSSSDSLPESLHYDADVDDTLVKNKLCTCVNLIERKIFCSCRLLNLSIIEGDAKLRKLINKSLNIPHQNGSKQPQTQFSRSAVGGSKYLLSCHPTLEPGDLIFESRFESGNLGKAVKITPTYYELYLRPDMYTNRHTQWFYFRVSNVKKNVIYR